MTDDALAARGKQAAGAVQNSFPSRMSARYGLAAGVIRVWTVSYQNSVPGPPLNGPTSSDVIQPP